MGISSSDAFHYGCQAGSLVWTAWAASVRGALGVVVGLVSLSVWRGEGQDDGSGSVKGAIFYEGHVHHVRRKPVRHGFQYPVRLAVVDLGCPPAWFIRFQARGHLTAAEARRMCGVREGCAAPVKLLTNPVCFGYEQNPISVYYVYEEGGAGVSPNLAWCIAEVTNTPWGERVRFRFAPSGKVGRAVAADSSVSPAVFSGGAAGDTLPKCLHVSPLMDMDATWTLLATAPEDQLRVAISIDHPVLGRYFDAVLQMVRQDVADGHSRHLHARNERAGTRNLMRYGLLPHRVACWIYLHAVLLLRKGVAFFPKPTFADTSARPGIAAQLEAGRPMAWCPAAAFPWAS